MTVKEGIREIQHKFDVNAIFAHSVFMQADKTRLLEDAGRIISEKPMLSMK